MYEVVLMEFEFTKINLIKLQRNYWFLIQLIKIGVFHNSTMGINLWAKQEFIF